MVTLLAGLLGRAAPHLRRALPAVTELAGAALIVAAVAAWRPLVGLGLAGAVMLAAANAKAPPAARA